MSLFYFKYICVSAQQKQKPVTKITFTYPLTVLWKAKAYWFVVQKVRIKVAGIKCY